jgi:hypothetical protein
VLILSSVSLLNYREHVADECPIDPSVDSTAVLTFKMMQALKSCTATPIIELRKCRVTC